MSFRAVRIIIKLMLSATLLCLLSAGNIADCTADSAKLNDSLVAAVVKNDPTEVERLLSLHANPNLSLSKLPTPENEHTEYQRARRNLVKGTYTCSILQWAACKDLPIHGGLYDGIYEVNKNTIIVGLLLAFRANVNVRDSSGRTALMLAAWKYRKGNVLLLLAHHADLDSKDNYGSTALSKLMYASWQFPNAELSMRSEIRNILSDATNIKAEPTD